MPDRLSTNTKPTSEPIWISEQSRLTRSGPIWSDSRPMAKVAATAVSRISEIASVPRAGDEAEIAAEGHHVHERHGHRRAAAEARRRQQHHDRPATASAGPTGPPPAALPLLRAIGEGRT